MGLATTAFSAGAKVEKTLPGEVFDFAHTQGCVFIEFVNVFKVDGLATDVHGLECAKGIGFTSKRDVDRSQEDMGMLAVEHDEEEDQNNGDLEQNSDGFEDLVG